MTITKKEFEKLNAQLLDIKTPLVFADGFSVYNKFARRHVPHKKGFFILAPSGSGKTYFVDHQKEKHWVDGDILWKRTGAHPKGDWWHWGKEAIIETDQKSDIITIQAKKFGFWIIGASNDFLIPDAIAIPPWNTHKKYITSREARESFDGEGATSDGLEQVKNHRKIILQYTKQGVPKFDSIVEATDYLASLC